MDKEARKQKWKWFRVTCCQQVMSPPIVEESTSVRPTISIPTSLHLGIPQIGLRRVGSSPHSEGQTQSLLRPIWSSRWASCACVWTVWHTWRTCKLHTERPCGQGSTLQQECPGTNHCNHCVAQGQTTFNQWLAAPLLLGQCQSSD